jgi:hypothetical protein
MMPKTRRARRPFRPQDQSIRKPAGLHRVPAPRGGRRNHPTDAVKAYHSVLERTGIKPQRTLQQDLQLTTNKMSYR